MRKIILIAYTLLFFKLLSSLSIGYLGEMGTHPGFFLGIEQNYFKSEKLALSLREEFIHYSHIRNHSLTGIQLLLPIHFLPEKRLSPEFSVGLAYLFKSTNGGDVYTLDSDGGVKKRDYKFSHRFGIPLNLALTYKAGSFTKKIISLKFKAGVLFEYPSNSDFMVHPLVGLGVCFD